MSSFKKFLSIIKLCAIFCAFSIFVGQDVLAENTVSMSKNGTVAVLPQPKAVKLKEKMRFSLYIDDHFDKNERPVVLQGINEWVRATNGMITIEDHVGWTSDDDMKDIPVPNKVGLTQCTKTIHIAKVNHDFPLVKVAEDELGEILGLTQSGCKVKFVLLVMDRIDDLETLLQTSTHEMGHVLGLAHIPVPYSSIMYPNNSKPGVCVTALDLAQLCDNPFFACDVSTMSPCISEGPKNKR